MPGDSFRVAAVVVAYRPDIESLRLLMEVLTLQVARTILVVNGPLDPETEAILAEIDPSHTTRLTNTRNVGLAAAQNQGIEVARQQGTDAVVFFDQDSLPPSGTVAALEHAWLDREANRESPGAVGVAYQSEGSRHWPGFVSIHWWGFGRRPCRNDADVVEADFLISSGSLIPMHVLDDVGGMDEALFVDHVDTEWCLRAASKGYRFFGVCGVRMTHALGEHSQRIWFGRWRQVSSHHPVRYYYMFRNSALLYRRHYVRLDWKLGDLLRSLQMLVFFGLFASRRREVLKMMFRGWFAGFRGHIGEVV
jgi:rhamnosyltransferase